MSNDTLDPCRFCKSSKVRVKHGRLTFVVCDECGAQGPSIHADDAGNPEQAARDAWNQPMSNDTDIVEALRRIADGDYPMPHHDIYRSDGVHSKHDRCPHGQWMYDGCDECCADYARQACSECGSIAGPKGSAGLNERNWECPECGSRHDRNINAALNIRAAGRCRLAGETLNFWRGGVNQLQHMKGGMA